MARNESHAHVIWIEKRCRLGVVGPLWTSFYFLFSHRIKFTATEVGMSGL